jgi:hypothetical protein
MLDQTGLFEDVEPEGPTDEELEEAYALDESVNTDRSEEEQERRINETASRVREENRLAEEAEAERLAAIQEAVLAEGQAISERDESVAEAAQDDEE